MGHHNSKSTQALYSSDRDDSPERPPSYKTTYTREKPSDASTEIEMPNDEFHKQLEALEHKHALKIKSTDDDILDLDFVRAKVAALQAAVEERDRTIKTQTGQLNSLEKKSKGTESTNTLAPRSRYDVMDNAMRKVKSKSDAELEALLARKPKLPLTLYYSVDGELRKRRADREYAMADDLF